MFILPSGTTYWSSVRGSANKFVRCEQCNLEYVYSITREGRGEVKSLFSLTSQGPERRAAEIAQVELRKALERGDDPVPCPACGWYQQPMIGLVRRQRHNWMRRLSSVAFILFFFASVLAFIFTMARGPSDPWSACILLWAVAGLLLGAAIGFQILRFSLSRRYDPNLEDPEARKKLGRARAISKQEFLARRHEAALRVLAENPSPS